MIHSGIRNRRAFALTVEALETRRVCDAGPLPVLGTAPGPDPTTVLIAPALPGPSLTAGDDSSGDALPAFDPTPLLIIYLGCDLTLTDGSTPLPPDLVDAAGDLATGVGNEVVIPVLLWLTPGWNGDTVPVTGDTVISGGNP